MSVDVPIITLRARWGSWRRGPSAWTCAPPRRRGFCSPVCANRFNVAAHRARMAATP
ncbi:CGNR zinc finger domain-containing protein [Nonomuraea sp. NPDC048916]|uniref:CGNR zinc finger domain-containing protein n=1 Tax=Nonomuraea sp. NPDC048916 TaxID=3154232 RepID=UPI00340987E0